VAASGQLAMIWCGLRAARKPISITPHSDAEIAELRRIIANSPPIADEGEDPDEGSHDDSEALLILANASILTQPQTEYARLFRVLSQSRFSDISAKAYMSLAGFKEVLNRQVRRFYASKALEGFRKLRT